MALKCKNKHMIKELKLSMLFFILVFNVSAQELKVNITGLRNDVGVIRLAFFIDSESFKNETPEISKTISKKNINNNNLTVVLTDIPPGRYGVALLDDENKNDEMDYNLLGIPKEGFGFSNYVHSGIRKPDLESFSFDFYEDKTIEIRVRYIY